MLEVTTADALVEAIVARNSTRIGIDGTDGSGKSRLAQTIAPPLRLPVIFLDEYLTKQQGGFLDFLAYDRLRRDLAAVDGFVVEGVCLLEALERAHVEIDCLVYVKRLHLGLWADERELEIDEAP